MTQDDRKQRGVSRRSFIKGAVATGAVVATGGTTLRGANAARTATPPPPPVCAGTADMALINGNFLTMDASNSVASAITIRGGRIAEVGSAGTIGACSQTVDLHGATVIPGLIDSHLHFIRDGLNPGHEVRIIELASSVAELQQMISDRAASVPAGEFITCVGGWNRNAFGGTGPNLAQLTAAAPNHPVYLSETGGGGLGYTNTLGKAFFDSKGVTVNPTTGTLAAATGFLTLRNAELAGEPIVSNRQTGTGEAIDFVASLGMTMVHDVGGNGGFAGVNALFVDLKPYDQALNLWRQNNLKVRIRTFLWSGVADGYAVAAARMANNYKRVGDDVFRMLGVGEIVNPTNTEVPGFAAHCQLVAANGWTLQQHSSLQTEIPNHILAFQGANALNPIKDLRWSLTHVNSITDAQIQAMVAMGTGVTVQSSAYTSGTTTGGNVGTPFRAILDQMGAAGIPVGGGSDATNVGPINPWLMMYFMFTGRNNAGVVINNVRGASLQMCTRMEALRMYTMGSAYFSFDDDRVGSIETGKLADLAVLSDNPLTVSDSDFRRIHSKATLQAGKLVYGSLS